YARRRVFRHPNGRPSAPGERVRIGPEPASRRRATGSARPSRRQGHGSIFSLSFSWITFRREWDGRVESARKLVEVAPLVHAMFMAIGNGDANPRAHADTIFMGCCRALRWTIYVPRRLR